ncbi:hypothetical protein E05_39180 [Plautia stali symbiont]|nr:hypothetical protein E05_39180 [Plautia stali symbiont]
MITVLPLDATALLPTDATAVPDGIVPAIELVSLVSRLPVTVAAVVTASVVKSDTVLTVVVGNTLMFVVAATTTA